MLIGAVADDVTGATDLCLMLSREGMKTVQVMGVPDRHEDLPEADAIVIALKSRTIEPAEAVRQSVLAARSLLDRGAEQLLFKYCSTFDSTDRGNIGPVAEALQDLTGNDLTIACPSFPAAGRTVYKGHLFVNGRLLSESPLKDHPLTPMRDPDLVRVLQRQTARTVGLLDWPVINDGEAAIRAALDRQRAAGLRIVVADTLSDQDLRTLGAACIDMKLVTGGSGIGMGLASEYRRRGRFEMREQSDRMPASRGRAAILAGSCSVATRNQIDYATQAGAPALRLDIEAIRDGRQDEAGIAEWVAAQDAGSMPIVYSSAGPDELAKIQSRFGRETSGELIEQTLGGVAKLLLQRGFAQFIVAGGETSGAVINALGVKSLSIGPEIDPGVPWTRSLSGRDVTLALKSGNFGGPDFFRRAWSMLDVEAADERD